VWHLLLRPQLFAKVFLVVLHLLQLEVFLVHLEQLVQLEQLVHLEQEQLVQLEQLVQARIAFVALRAMSRW